MKYSGNKKIKVNVCGSCFWLLLLSIFVTITFPQSVEAQSVRYRAHVANDGWMPWVQDGQTAGTTGQGLQMEALQMTGSQYSIEYKAHVSGIGWQGWVRDGATAGTTEEGRAMEAAQIRLLNAPSCVRIQYRAHVANKDWMPWVQDGQTAGTTGLGLQMEAIEIKIISDPISINSINPNTATKGQQVTFTLSGTGFQPGFTAKLINELNQGFNISSTQYINCETVKVTVFLGSGPTSTQTVRIINPNGQSASINFTAIGINPNLQISTNPSGPWSTTATGQQGTTFYIQGSGFSPNSTATQDITKPDRSKITGSVSVNSSRNLSWNWTSTCNDLTGTYTIFVKDSSGVNSNSVKEIITFSSNCDKPPVVSITSPSDGQTVKDQVTVIATASDDNGVSKVEFYLDGRLKFTDVSSPYLWSWDTNQSNGGSYTLKAIAYDTINQQSAPYQITIVVNKPSPVLSISTNPSGPWSTSATGQQGTTFYIQGSGFSPNSTATQGITKPDRSQITGQVSVKSSGNLSWNWTSQCSDLTGTYTIFVKDSSGVNSNSVTESVTPDPNCCNYTISPTTMTFSSDGGIGNVSVTTDISCSWSSVSNNSWITITTGSNGIGNGMVSYSVSSNTDANSRIGTINIAGKTVTITQQGQIESFIVTEHLMTDIDEVSNCDTPPSKTIFLDTDPRATAWFSYKNANIGDPLKWEWYQPDGSLYFERDRTFNKVNGCKFAYIYINGNLAMSLPGLWEVKAYRNNKIIFTESFTIKLANDNIKAPNLKLPLPGNKSWLLSVEAGGKRFAGGLNEGHTGNGFYSLDIDDYTKEDGQLIDVTIFASGDGQVVEAGWSSGTGGYTVIIDHDLPYDGSGFKTRYSHMKEEPSVSKGQMVTQGQVIGIMGDTGNSLGTHIHFQVYYNWSSVSSNEKLQGIVIDGLKIEEYKVGTNDPWNPIYYLSSNTDIKETKAAFTMTSDSQSAQENETLTLSVPQGQTVKVNFSAARSFAPDGFISSYKWQINGTEVSNLRDFTSDLGEGPHSILLTVEDNQGGTAFVGGTVVVSTTIPEGLTVNPKNRDESEAFYREHYLVTQLMSAEDIINWTGNHDLCDAGTTSQEFRDEVLHRVNYFRAMAGVPAGVVFDDSFNSKAQEAALMMSVNRDWSHDPPTSWTCFSDDGAEAAGNSNLWHGSFGWSGIDGFIRDKGDNNKRVGHRNWILFPQTQVMGTGDIPQKQGFYSACALWVIDDNIFAPQPTIREEFVAWPPPGFVPLQVVYPRWSFTYSEADFLSASVTMTRNGSNFAVGIEHRGDGDLMSTLVWKPISMNPGEHWPLPNEDEVYTVNIRNALIDGIEKSFTYNVTIFDLTPEPPNKSPVAAFTMTSGSQSAQENETLTLSVSPGQTARVNFSAARSTDPDGFIASYKWQINGTEVSNSIDFDSDFGEGTHSIFLTVTDYQSATASVGGTVVVNNEFTPILSISTNPSGPWSTTAAGQQGTTFYIQGSNFSPNSTGTQDITEPDDSLFTGTIPVNGSGNLSWSYPSGCSDSVGTYTILVKDSLGINSNTVTETINSSPDCTTNTLSISSIDPDLATKGQTTIFALTGAGFQDGFTAKRINELGEVFDVVSTQYMSTFTVKVTIFLGDDTTSTQTIRITNPHGQSDSINFTAIGDAPVSSFAGEPLEGSAPLTVNFTNTSSGEIETWEWDFGDGTFSNLENPAPKIYDNPGLYTVSLTVEGPGGIDTAEKTDYINVTELEVSLELLNPVRELLDSSSDITADKEILASKGEPAKGVSADGLANLVLRLNTTVPGTAIFNLLNDKSDELTPSDDMPEYGHIMNIGPGGPTVFNPVKVTVATVPTLVGDKAFINYIAPDQFVRKGSDEDKGKGVRNVFIKCKFTPTDINILPVQITKSIEIHRPPIVLIHGLWSDRSTWEFPLANDSIFNITKADYKDWNASSFKDNELVPVASINKAIKDMQSKGIASVKADVIGHSMGGILTRIYINSLNYENKTNYFQGDVNKLITLDTPHFGAELAEYFTALVIAVDTIDDLINPLIPLNPLGDFLRGQLDCNGYSYGDAFSDLRPGHSPIMSLSGKHPHSYALVGVGGQDVLNNFLLGASDIIDLNGDVTLSRLKGLYIILSIWEGIIKLGIDPTDIFGEVDHDLLVATESQRGGIDEDSWKRMDGLDSVHVMNTVSDNYSDEIKKLLNLPINVTGDPAFSIFADGSNNSSSLVEAEHYKSKIYAMAEDDIPTGILRITSPEDDSQVLCGETIHFTIDDIDGDATSVVLIGAFVTQIDNEPPFEFDITIPPNLGDLVFSAVGNNDSGKLFLLDKEITVLVSSKAKIEDINIDPSSVYLLSPDDSESISVSATFDDGTISDISNANLGYTKYSSTNTNVMNVSSDGIVTPISDGTADVVVDVNDEIGSSFSKTVTVTVEFSDVSPPPPPELLSVNPSVFRRTLRAMTAVVTVRDQTGIPKSGITIGTSVNHSDIVIEPNSTTTNSDGNAIFKFKFPFRISGGEITFTTTEGVSVKLSQRRR